MKVNERITETRIIGNIIANTWFKSIGKKVGGKFKPDLLAINILGEIWYWYRLKEIRDEATGRFLRYEKKFAADKLQLNYAAIAERFGISKIRAKRAVDLLVWLGVITREFRNFASKTGLPMSNVMFVEPVPDVLIPLSLQKSKDGLTDSSGGGRKNVDTYTETTTVNSTEKEKESRASFPQAPAPSTSESLRQETKYLSLSEYADQAEEMRRRLVNA